jgi:hypothetical protein
MKSLSKGDNNVLTFFKHTAGKIMRLEQLGNLEDGMKAEKIDPLNGAQKRFDPLKMCLSFSIYINDHLNGLIIFNLRG